MKHHEARFNNDELLNPSSPAEGSHATATQTVSKQKDGWDSHIVFWAFQPLRFTSIWEIVNDLVLQELFKGSDGVTFTGLKVWGPNGRYPNVFCG